jgi:hypothetical protein
MMRVAKMKKMVGMCVVALGMAANAETIAYWQFQDSPAGTPAPRASVLKSQVNSPVLDAKVCPSAAVKVTFSSDVPGEVIVAGPNDKVVNAHNQASVKAVRKSGQSDAVTVASNELLNLDDFTIEAFVKIESFPRWGRIFHKKRNQSRFSWILSLKDRSGLLRARIDSDPDNAKHLTGFNQGVQTTFKLDDKQWHHLAFSYDALTQEVALYADYQLQAKAKTPLPILYGDQPIAIFGAQSGGFSALVDDMRISDAILLPEDFLRVKGAK